MHELLHLLHTLLVSVTLGLAYFNSHTPLIVHKLRTEDVVEVGVCVEQALQGQPLIVHKVLQSLAFFGIEGSTVYHHCLACFVPHHVAVFLYHVDLKTLQVELLACHSS